MITWNAAAQTDQENLAWSFLRALEWEAFPAFVSQPVVPILFIFEPWYLVIGAVFLLMVIWLPFRNSFVVPIVSELAVFFVKLKWISVPVAAIYLFYSGHYILAIASLLWTLIAAGLGFILPGGRTNVIQKRLMNALGYENREF